MRRFHANFSYQAGTWTKPRRVIAKVEWHPGELYPRVGFIVTNMSPPAERVVAFYNKRGTCEQWIKEGKGAIKWTRLSCRTFAANAVRQPANLPVEQPTKVELLINLQSAKTLGIEMPLSLLVRADELLE